MRKFLLLTAILLGMTAGAAYAQPDGDGDQEPKDTVVVPPRQITYFGSGGVVVYPDGTTFYCPNPGTEVCAISNGNYPNDTITMYGSGGTVVRPDGTTFYCPIDARTVCAIFVRQNPTGGTVTIFGSGGRVVRDDGSYYCPLEGNTVCVITPTRGYIPDANAVGHNTTMGDKSQGITVFDMNGNPIEVVYEAADKLPQSPDVKQGTKQGTGATIE